MSDIKISDRDWVKLRNSALYFLPALISVDASQPIERRALLDKSRQLASEKRTHEIPFSTAALTSVFNLRPLGYQKCVSVLDAYNALSEEYYYPKIETSEIVAAVFYAPDLGSILSEAKLKSSKFSDLPGAHFYDTDIVEGLLRRERVPFAVAARIAKVIAVSKPDLKMRDVFSAKIGHGVTTIVKSPRRESILDMDDLIPATKFGTEWTDWSNLSGLPDGVP